MQTAVDTKHYLIVAHIVTNDRIDRDQLTSMAKLVRTEMAVDKLTAVADRGYDKSEEMPACHEAGINVFVPKAVTSSATANGRFGKDDFICDARTKEYQCPAGERLIGRFSTVEHGLKLSKYWGSNCPASSLEEDCTPGPQRRMARREHEAVLDGMQARLDHAPGMMLIRRQTVEHPFGTIKSGMGATHFLIRTIERVSTEMSLRVLAYNMKRVIKLLGSEAVMKAMRV